MSENNKIIDKIRKCLALSKSANEHEAAAALRQAQKLMAANSVTVDDIQAAEVSEHAAKSAATAKPAVWEALLANKIARAFGCELIFARPWLQRTAEYRFIGCGSAPEVAGYAFSVLQRQARSARQEYIKTQLKRCKSATKTRRADLFSEGWVTAVAGKISAFAGTESESAAIQCYMAKHHKKLGSLDPRDRNKHNQSTTAAMDYASGRISGKNAQLNRGVGGVDQRKALK